MKQPQIKSTYNKNISDTVAHLKFDFKITVNLKLHVNKLDSNLINIKYKKYRQVITGIKELTCSYNVHQSIFQEIYLKYQTYISYCKYHLNSKQDRCSSVTFCTSVFKLARLYKFVPSANFHFTVHVIILKRHKQNKNKTEITFFLKKKAVLHVFGK